MSLMPYAEFLLGAGLGAFYLPLKTPSSKILACVAGYIGFVLGALAQCVGAAALGYQVPPAPDALGVFAVAGIAPAAVIGAVAIASKDKWFSRLQSIHFYSSYAIGLYALFHFDLVANVLCTILIPITAWQIYGTFELAKPYNVFGIPPKGAARTVSEIERQKYDVFYLSYGEDIAKAAYSKGYIQSFSNSDLVIRELLMAAIAGGVSYTYRNPAGLALICWHVSSALMRLGRRGMPSVLYLAASGLHATHFLQRFQKDCGGGRFRCVSLLRHEDYASKHLVLDSSSLRVREETLPGQNGETIAWHEAIRWLIHIAPIVVVDARVVSEHLRYELGLIQSMNALEKTFVIVDDAAAAGGTSALPGHTTTVEKFIEFFAALIERGERQDKYQFGDPATFPAAHSGVPALQ